MLLRSFHQTAPHTATPSTPQTHLRPIALAVLLVTSNSAWAEAALQRSYDLFDRSQKTVSSRELPGFLLADQLEGQTDDQMVARGNVEMRQSNSQIWSDELIYWPLQDEVEAKGNVRFHQGGNQFYGPYLKRNLTDMTGHFDQPHYLIRREIKRKKNTQNLAPGVIGLDKDVPEVRITFGSGQAEKIDFLGEQHLLLNKATYSSCRPEKLDWYMRSSSIDLNYDEDNGQSKHSTIFFKEVPILYWPSMSFPVNNARRSGFLPPTFMSSTSNGMDLTIPYYLNLAPDYDLLLNPRYIAQRGTQVGGEFRYLDYNYTGHLRFESLEDQKFGAGRQAYSFNHTQTLGRGLSTAIQWNGVSDGEYFTDLTTRLVQTSQTHLPRQVVLNYAPSPWISTSTRYLSYQTLKQDISKPYALEPQINLTGRNPYFYGADVRLIGQLTQFTHPTQVQGQRWVAYPQISLPYESPAFFFRPKLGLHATQYSLNTQNVGNSNETRVLPTFTLDSGLVFERDTMFGGRNTVQTLEPRLYYVNIPYKNQFNLPIFDTAIGDFNFAQIFSENRYLGHDRINNANQLTAALSTRLIDAETGAERMKAMLGQRYYFDSQKVFLNSAYSNLTEVARQDNFSSVIGAFSGLVAYRTYLESAVEYNYREEKTMRYALGGRYQPGVGKVISATYRFNRDQATLTSQIEQYDIAAQWPLFGRWYAVGRYNYSIQDQRPLETIAGFEYNAGCWMGRFVAQKLEIIPGKPNTILFFQLELNDFAQLGTNPLQLLRRSIPGYGKINEVDSGSLIQ